MKIILPCGVTYMFLKMKTMKGLYLLIHFYVGCVQSEHLQLLFNQQQQINCTEKKIITISYLSFDWLNTGCPLRPDHCKEGKENIREKCEGKNSCSIDSRDYDTANCLTPRHMNVNYKCSGWFTTYNRETTICGSLSGISCNWRRTISAIDATYLRLPDPFDFRTDQLTACINARFDQFCLYRSGSCEISQILRNIRCFYLPFQVNIIYSCISNGSSSSPTEEPVQSFTQPQYVTQQGFQRNKSLGLPKAHMLYKVSIDEDQRLLITNLVLNRTFTVCGRNWTDFHAQMACLFLNVSENGRAGLAPRDRSYDRIAYGFSCEMNSSDPFSCIPDMSNSSAEECKTIDDAAVHCLQPISVNANDDFPNLETGSLIGLIAGVLILILITALAVFLIIRKLNYCSKDNKTPIVSDNKKVKYDPAWEDKEIQLHPAAYRDKPENDRNLSAAQNQRNDQNDLYMDAKEGVYDVTNNKRYKDRKDENVYSHAVDDVYDVSGNNRGNQNINVNLYDVNLDDVYNVGFQTAKQKGADTIYDG